MSIDSKHAYRFVYLKSDHWQAVRLEALAREKGQCQICGHFDLSNDAHHVWYPKNIYDTKAKHLIILCRPCHNFIHEVYHAEKFKTFPEGLSAWNHLRAGVMAWRLQKIALFRHINEVEEKDLIRVSELRLAFSVLKFENERLRKVLTDFGICES